MIEKPDLFYFKDEFESSKEYKERKNQQKIFIELSKNNLIAEKLIEKLNKERQAKKEYDYNVAVIEQIHAIGGLKSQIGRALAIQLAESGCNLALVDWNKKTLKETEELVRKKI